MNMLVLLLLMLAIPGAHAATVWVEREDYHTALIVTTADAASHAPALRTIIGEKKYVRLGWGDRDFYGASRKTPVMLAKALFLPTSSVIEVASLARPEEYSTSLHAVPLDEPEMRQLMHFIEASLAPPQNGQPVLVRQEPSGFRYYAARGNYHLLRNCNNWTAKALHQAGHRMHYRTTFLAGIVMRQLK